VSQAERHAKQQELAAQQAAAVLRQRQALRPRMLAVLVHMAYADTYPPPGCWAAHWVSNPRFTPK
jgi:hypothetical protein